MIQRPFLSIRPGALVLLGLFLALTLVLLLSAWLCDDAYITFRTVENTLSGHGPRWNVAERVQSFTHPLWFLLLIPLRAFTGNLDTATMLFSILISLGTAALLVASMPDRKRMAPLLLLVLIFSRALVDYSTSGLENPLSHLLIVALACRVWSLSRREPSGTDIAVTSLLFSGILLCRLDLALLVGPLFLPWFLADDWRRNLRMFLLGLAPFFLWELFALVYYGSFISNTAYAKLGTDNPLTQNLSSGMIYLLQSSMFDPLTGLIILTAIICGIVSKKPKQILGVVGIFLYLLYILFIGGDFMAGRFLTAPMILGLFLLGRRTFTSRGPFEVALASIVAAGFLAIQPTVTTGPHFGLALGNPISPSGVADERAFYYPATGLFRAIRLVGAVDHPWARNGVEARDDGQKIAIASSVGFFGYFAGPGVHVIDCFGLCDPLMSRMPGDRREPWRIGHLPRYLPPLYPESALDASSGIEDPEVAELDNQVRLMTRGPLFSPDRWKAIVYLAPRLGPLTEFPETQE